MAVAHVQRELALDERQSCAAAERHQSDLDGRRPRGDARVGALLIPRKCNPGRPNDLEHNTANDVATVGIDPHDAAGFGV